MKIEVANYLRLSLLLKKKSHEGNKKDPNKLPHLSFAVTQMHVRIPVSAR